ncbi:hypothetical protein DV451_004656 [Geotrichum candidum]|uniref:Uncharacterized protein n=1 Tax=Geotrichum candidum TaxID=1173061 RepID=A0A9P5G0H9_GEOCN|nr:hypothetical protein DV451_004656 [Geotrichum candidum]KAF5110516.1 hypothetical protein DV453_000876 [Geotrichum candidum]
MTASIQSSHHAHRSKHISPALSDLLSSTTISSRTKRKSLAQQPTPEPTLNFTKKSVQSANHQRTPSQIHKQIFNSPADAPANLTNIPLVRPTPQPGCHRNDLEDPIEESAITQQQLFSLEYALDDTVDLTPISKPFFQFLRNMELSEEDDDLSTDDDDMSSFSSLNSSLSGISPVSFTSTLRGKNSMCLAKPQPKIRSLEASPVDHMSHPLSSLDDAVDDSDMPESSGDKNKIKKIVSRLGNSFKALRTAATSFSASQQNLLSSTNVFTFQPRSTDEPIPASVSVVPTAVSTPVQHTEPTTLPPSAKPRSKIRLQAAVVPKPQAPKPIPLKTYFVQEYALPSKSREVRENSSFYRVYALEVLMRQHGKLDPEFPGKAQVALLPRNDDLPARARFPMFHGHWQHDGSNKVPRRWVPICASDL